jgi:pilin/secretion family protein with methylation motif
MNDQRGFSVAELLIAAAMTSVLMLGVFTVLQQGQVAYLFGASRAEVQQTARGALDRTAHELRLGSVVSAATATSVTFQFLDDAGVTVTVQYSLNGTNLQRNQTVPVPVAAQPETVIGGVTALAFTYYDANNVVTTTAANVRTVNIRLTTGPQDTTLASYSPANQKFMVEDRVRLRNLL